MGKEYGSIGFKNLSISLQILVMFGWISFALIIYWFCVGLFQGIAAVI